MRKPRQLELGRRLYWLHQLRELGLVVLLNLSILVRLRVQSLLGLLGLLRQFFLLLLVLAQSLLVNALHRKRRVEAIGRQVVVEV